MREAEMNNYVVVFNETNRAPAFVKGDTIRFDNEQLQIISDEHGIVFVTPLALIHHANLVDENLVNYDGPKTA